MSNGTWLVYIGMLDGRQKWANPGEVVAVSEISIGTIVYLSENVSLRVADDARDVVRRLREGMGEDPIPVAVIRPPTDLQVPESTNEA